MPKISIVALRWLLVLVNVLALGLVVSRSYTFFQGSADELRTPLPEIASVTVPPPQQSGENVDVSRLIADIERRPPARIEPTSGPKVPELAPPPPPDGGPLASKYAISVVIANPSTGEYFASLVDAQQEERGLPNPARSTIASRRTRTNTRTVRAPTRGRPRPPQAAAKGEFVQVGDVLQADTDPCEIIAITYQPPTVRYLNRGRECVLEEVVESPEVQIEEHLDAEGRVVKRILYGVEVDDESAAQNRQAMEAANVREGSITTSADRQNAKEAPKLPPGKGANASEDRAGAVRQTQPAPPRPSLASDEINERAKAAKEAQLLKEALEKISPEELDPEKREELKRAAEEEMNGREN